MNFKKLIKNLGFQILVAMLLGTALGIAMGPEATVFAPLGDVFIGLIKMLVVPLVAISIISGAASLGATKSAGKIGISTIGYFLITTVVSVTLGLLLGEIFSPGKGLDKETVLAMFPAEESPVHQTADFWTTLQSIIPENPIESLVSGNILQIIFFGLFLGIGISTLPKQKKEPLMNGMNYLIEALIWMIKVVMWTAPVGVFGLMASSIGSFGFDLLKMALDLMWVNLIGGAIILLGLYPLTLKLFSKTSIRQFFAKMTKAQIVALSTSSSMATLPINMEVCEEELGVSKATTGFVLPLGATINMTGSALYYALVAVFFAQLFGIELSIAQYIAIIITSTVGSIGQAGVPGPSLLVVAVLVSADIPIAGLPLLYALDRVFDMLRTAFNITGDAACAIIVDRFNK
ncbi:dicarboxylate/amino acid:cation symporter [Carboxylicivirga sediminis]|uniref:Dicarboxylate/amino acid:cation symporter n=1 Tax=Carboxylicivirga sediminis TaxID=2006564 RepID=A0A941IYV0_9BACT|nr:dicarboxylate/amino acid:cation symporter [Carboxylicivirga sediminis]MBR8536879.1 dicarboxylate/amino acid:cation symporter [Carboxylicivirga sediminis]